MTNGLADRKLWICSTCRVSQLAHAKPLCAGCGKRMAPMSKAKRP